MESEYVLTNGKYLIWNLDTNSILTTTNPWTIDTENYVTLVYVMTNNVVYGIFKPMLDNWDIACNFKGDIYMSTSFIEYEKLDDYTCLIKPNGLKIYYYTNNSKSSSITLNSDINLSSGQYLVWDLDTNSTEITTSPWNKTKNKILLAYCLHGTIINGELKALVDKAITEVEKRKASTDDLMVRSNAILNSGKDIYILELNNCVYIKFAYIYYWGKGSMTWSAFKTLVGDDTKFQTSPDGTADCLKLNEYEMLLNDFTVFDYYNNQPPIGKFPLLTCFNGNVIGCLVDIYRGQPTHKIDTLNIQNGYTRTKGNVKNTFNSFMLRAINKMTDSSFSYLLVSDTHFYSGKDYAYRYQNLLRVIENNVPISVILDCGDSLQDGVNTKEEMFNRLVEYNANKQMIRSPYINTVGNHDANAIFTNSINVVLTNKERCGMFATIKQDGAIFNNDDVFGNYYYYDDDVNKVRYISLNCHDIPYISEDGVNYKFSGFSQANYSNKQLNWVANVALNLEGKEDYLVIPIGHSPLNSTGIIDADAQPANSNIMYSIFKAFVEGAAYNYTGSNKYDNYNVNVDFTGKNGIIPVHHFGHTHRDNYAVNTFNMYNAINLNKNISTHANGENEFTFNIVTIDKNSRKVYITRHGNGEDFEFSY